MRFKSVLMFMFVVAGCGDNIVPEGTPTSRSPSATSSVGGAQTSHSKSFMLVTSVASGHEQVAKSKKFTIKPGVGGER